MKSQEAFEKVVFKIIPITPVHIAGGSFLLENRDYFVDKREIHRIYYPSLIDNIPEENINQALQMIKNEGIRSLLPRPRKKVEKNKVEEDWKQVLRQRVGLPVPIEEKEEEPEHPEEMANWLEHVELYKCPLRDEIGSKIQAMALDSSRRSYFPGSSIKGAIRTALYVDNILREPARLNRLRFTWTNNPIEADYPLDRDMSGLELQDFGKDIFRQLWVRDSSYRLPADSLDVFQVRIMNIAAEEGEPQKLVWKKSGKKNVSSYRDADSLCWEMVKPQVEFKTEIVIDQELRHLLGASDTREAALDIRRESLTRSLNIFSKLVAEHELSFAEKFQIPYLRDFYQDLHRKCEEALLDGTVAYMPIGSGLPWHAKTVGKLLENAGLERIRRHFYRYMGKFIYLPLKTSFHGMRLRRGQLGGKPIHPEKLKSVEPFPKTRHYVFVDGQPAYPPGWICLQLQP